MFAVRSFRRVAVAVTVLGLPCVLYSFGCATGGSGESGEGGGPFEGGPPPVDAPKGDTTLQDQGPNPDTSPGSDTGEKDTGDKDSSKKDSGSSDAPSDAPPPDLGPPDTGKDTGSCTTVAVSDAGAAAVACPAPGVACGKMSSLSAYSPTWTPPSGLHTSKCTAAQITKVYNDCFNPDAGSATKCKADETTACYKCIITPDTASTWGPLVSIAGGGIDQLNQGGCIDLLEPCNKACAEAFQYQFTCTNAACGPNCGTITTNAEFYAYEACVADAGACDPGGCAEYTNESNNCGALLNGASHPASVCLGMVLPDGGTSTFEDLYNAIVPVFCGP